MKLYKSLGKVGVAIEPSKLHPTFGICLILILASTFGAKLIVRPHMHCRHFGSSQSSSLRPYQWICRHLVAFVDDLDSLWM